MILAQAGSLALAPAITLGAAPAHADVMAPGPAGARRASSPRAGRGHGLCHACHLPVTKLRHGQGVWRFEQ